LASDGSIWLRVSKEKLLMSDTRKKGVAYLQKRLGYTPSLIAVSKFYVPEESWTGKAAWWFDLPIKKVKSNKKGIYYLLGKKRKSSFVVLEVPTKFLRDNLKKFETRYKDIIRLHLAAEGKNRLVDERGKGRVDFSRFELTI